MVLALHLLFIAHNLFWDSLWIDLIYTPYTDREYAVGRKRKG